MISKRLENTVWEIIDKFSYDRFQHFPVLTTVLNSFSSDGIITDTTMVLRKIVNSTTGRYTYVYRL